MTAVVALAVGSTWDSWSSERQAQFAPILMTMSGNVILLIASAVFGALAVASEYSNGMIRLTGGVGGGVRGLPRRRPPTPL